MCVLSNAVANLEPNETNKQNWISVVLILGWSCNFEGVL